MNREELFRELKKRNEAASYKKALSSSVLILGLALCAAFAVKLLAEPLQAFETIQIIFAVSAISSVLSFIIIAAFSKEQLQKTAGKTDSEFGGMGRLETALELKDSESPLKEVQLESTLLFYSGKLKSNWTLFRLTAIIMLIGITSLFIVLLAVTHNSMELAMKEKAAKILDKKKNEPEKEKDFASLEIISPEPESRAKPIDEVIWEAKGDSSKGFSSISLELAVNGVPLKSIALKDISNAKGALKLDGELLLEELNLTPFDLVAYHLKGKTMIAGKEKEILSAPQFIEIRPFREDILKGGGGGAVLQKQMDSLMAILSGQIALNRAVFAARGSGLEADNKILLEQINILAKDQNDLKEELAKLLKAVPPELITPTMLENLSKGTEHMGKAGSNLEKGAKK